MPLTQLLTPKLTGHCPELKREEIKQYYLNSSETYQSLFSLINNEEAYFKRPERLRHPLIFYYGHTATFFINKLILGKYITQRINPKLEAICAVGVDEMSWDDLDSRHYDWPSVDEVKIYRQNVSDLVLALINEMDITLPITQGTLPWLIIMGCEHERIHLETSSVIMRQLDLSDLTPNSDWEPCSTTGNAPMNKLIDTPSQTIKIGKSIDHDTYGWDNEYGSLEFTTPDIAISKYLVSNQEYLAFVEDGGYRSPKYWTEEGQGWLTFTQADKPRFWIKKQGMYWQRNLTNEMPLPLNWPVEVNYLEAKAFCNWKSNKTAQYIRLLTEPEWINMRNSLPLHAETAHESANTNLMHFASSCPVDLGIAKTIHDIVGNVWQWTESSIDGYEGFKIDPIYDDFSTPTFDGQHNLIKGGSWISTGNETEYHSRYAFRRHFTQHAGFRYVQSKDEVIPQIESNQYITDEVITQEIDAQFTEEYFGIHNYAKELAKIIKHYQQKLDLSDNRLLDLGCKLGRTSFELAPYYQHIDAVDFSVQLIAYASRLQNGKSIRYCTENEGEILNFKEIELSDCHIKETTNKLYFKQGDASNLKSQLRGYDLIIMQQVLETHYDPSACLANLTDRLNSNGLLVIVSDYHFDRDNTDVPAFGGIKVNGENTSGFDMLCQTLSSNYALISEENLLKVTPQTRRNIKLSEQHVTIWQKQR